MIALLLFASLSLGGPQVQPAPLHASIEDPVQEGPDAKTIKAAVEALGVAFAKDTETPERLAGIEAAVGVPCTEVARALGKFGLKDKDSEVVGAALLVLGKMDVPEALDQLTSFHKKDRRLKKDEALLALTLKAIAWRGDVSTIGILSEDIFTDASKDVLRARILGLGRIRSTESVEALISVMKSAARNKVQPFMDDLSMSLTILTGVDQGKNQDRWIAWWNENKHELEVSAEQPEIDKLMQKKWDHFWGIKRPDERGEKREERGGDGS